VRSSFQENSFKQEADFDNSSIQIGAKNIDQVPEVKVEEPKMKKALDLGNIKS